MIPLPLVSVLFERGAFAADDTAATALAVAVYGAGLPAFVMQKVLQPLYFAREDTRSPFYFALAALVVNAAIANKDRMDHMREFFEGTGVGDTAGVWEGAPNLHPEFRARQLKKLEKQARAAKAAEMI